MFAFALAIFTGAFLLFQVQPLIAKYILPWFGGAPAVWTTCMLFFQVLLLGGYAYAHLTSRWLKPRVQAILHLVLLLAALALLPIIPSNSWKPTGPENPTLRILALLLSTLGLPYFVLSSTGPLMQEWFSRTNPGRSPYRLYALSNVGSLLALVSFPFFFEPHFTRKAQASLWGWGLAAFAVFCGFCAWRAFKSEIRTRKSEGTPKVEIREPEPALAAASGIAGARGKGIGSEDDTDGTVGGKSEASSVESVQSVAHAPSVADLVLWLLLPACASVLLLAVTNKLCQDVAVVPFLWVVPLSLYLLSFIICFDSPRWYERLPFRPALILALAALCWALPKGSETPLRLLIVLYSSALFLCCMVCHGELYRLRPDPQHLTSFYLMIAAGGALGGLLVAVVAPVVFNDYYELQWGMLGCGLLFLISYLREHSSFAASTSRQWRWVEWLLPLAMLICLDRVLAGAVQNPDSTREGFLVGLRVVVGAAMVLLAYIGLETRLLDKPAGRAWIFPVSLLVPWAARKKFDASPYRLRFSSGWILAGLVLLSATMWNQSHEFARLIVERTRNFYGVLTVFEDARNDPAHHHRALVHGQITHGLQAADPVGSTWPTAYFVQQSGVGRAIASLEKRDRHVGIIGLGIGTLAAYARTNDTFRYYEINPEVLRLAQSHFSYIAQHRASLQFALGDARLTLEKEAPQHFDLFVIDAFSGDAIPAHLLTKEAFQLYELHLKTNGVIAIHISNACLDLEPVLANVARELHYNIVAVDCNPWDPAVVENSPTGGDTWWVRPSNWILMTRSPNFLNSPKIREAARPPRTNPHLPLWTDDFTSLFQILK